MQLYTYSLLRTLLEDIRYAPTLSEALHNYSTATLISTIFTAEQVCNSEPLYQLALNALRHRAKEVS